MAISYEYNEFENIVYTRPFDTLTIADFVQYARQLQHDESIRPGFVEVVSFAAVQNFVLSYNDTWAMRQVFDRLRENKGYAGTVLIGGNDYLFGMARMFELALGENVILDVTRTLDEAKASVLDARQRAGLA